MTKSEPEKNDSAKRADEKEKFDDPQKQALYEAEAEIFRGLFIADEQYRIRGSAGWQLW
jgi:hypothetical protein